MQGSNLTRVARLVWQLVTHPSEISRYVSQSIRRNCSPMELGLPWISYDAIDCLDGYLRPEHRVAEFGGGGSTLFFARRVSEVRCVESSVEWADRLRAKLESEQIENVDLTVHPYDPDDADAFKTSDFLSALGDETYDVILVDCYEHSTSLRPDLFKLAEQRVADGGLIIVDDAWRYPELRNASRAIKWLECKSTGPCRPGVTTTELFFY